MEVCRRERDRVAEQALTTRSASRLPRLVTGALGARPYPSVS